jgi:hypothetical protein
MFRWHLVHSPSGQSKVKYVQRKGLYIFTRLDGVTAASRGPQISLFLHCVLFVTNRYGLCNRQASWATCVLHAASDIDQANSGNNLEQRNFVLRLNETVVHKLSNTECSVCIVPKHGTCSGTSRCVQAFFAVKLQC